MAAGAVSLKNLTKYEEVRKGADQANSPKGIRRDFNGVLNIKVFYSSDYEKR